MLLNVSRRSRCSRWLQILHMIPDASRWLRMLQGCFQMPACSQMATDSSRGLPNVPKCVYILPDYPQMLPDTSRCILQLYAETRMLPAHASRWLLMSPGFILHGSSWITPLLCSVFPDPCCMIPPQHLRSMMPPLCSHHP